MLTNLGVHVILNPAGTYSFVGTLPAVLGESVKATVADILAGRAEMNPHTGEAMTLKFPVFPSREAAIIYAENRGVKIHTIENKEHRFAPCKGKYPEYLYCSVCGASESGHRL